MKANNIKNIHEIVKREADERSFKEFAYNEAKWWEIIVNKPDSRINSRMLYNRIFNKSGLNFSEEEKQEMESLKEIVELLKTISRQVSIVKEKEIEKLLERNSILLQRKEVDVEIIRTLQVELDKAKKEIENFHQENEKLTHKFRFFLYLDHKKNKLKEFSKKLIQRTLSHKEKKFDEVKRKIKWDVSRQKYVVQIQVNPKN